MVTSPSTKKRHFSGFLYSTGTIALVINTMFFFLALLCVIVCSVYSQIPCDDAYGQYCPEESGFGVADCLKKQDLSLLSEGCINYIQMHDACKEDLNTHCPGKEFTGDALGTVYQ